ncbi:MAG TPA: hypothetical protein VEG64_17590 [Candidatus Sulfotelmatobacter sp.]|nr:hypothetical protein [Candidatus Sulfotelmatobacter sp.]
MMSRLARASPDFCVIALASLLFQANPRSQGASPKPTIVTVDRPHGRVAYTVDSKPVDLNPTDNILYALNKVQDRMGPDHPVLVYLDPQARVEDIGTVDGIAGKAQLNNLRFFAFTGNDHLMLREIKWAAGPPLSPGEALRGQDSRPPIIVKVRRTNSRLTFKLDPNPAPGKDILWGLSKLVGERGAGYPVVAVVDDHCPLADLRQVPGIAAKAGFHNTRTFISSQESESLAEIKFCTAVPISLSPPHVSACDSPQ